MSITVEPTYEMAKALGERRLALEGAPTVQEALDATRARFGDQAEAFDKLLRGAALAVNGVLVHQRHGLSTPLADGDRLSFVKTASGG